MATEFGLRCISAHKMDATKVLVRAAEEASVPGDASPPFVMTSAR